MDTPNYTVKLKDDGSYDFYIPKVVTDIDAINALFSNPSEQPIFVSTDVPVKPLNSGALDSAQPLSNEIIKD